MMHIPAVRNVEQTRGLLPPAMDKNRSIPFSAQKTNTL